MNSRYKSWFVFCAVVLLGSSVLWGQVKQRDKWEFSLFAGSSSFSDTTAATPVSGLDEDRLVRLIYDQGFLTGFRITENLNPKWGAELEYGFANQPMALSNLSTNISMLESSHQVHSLIYSFVFYPVPQQGRLQPFVVGGVGTDFFHVSSSSKAEAKAQGVQLRDRWTFAGAWGGGVKFKVAEQIGLRFDFRDQMTAVPDYGLPPEAPSFGGQVGAGFNPSGILNNMQLTAGVIFYWGNH